MLRRVVLLSVCMCLLSLGAAQARPAVFGLTCLGDASGTLEGTLVLDHATVPLWNVCYKGTALEAWPTIPDEAGTVRGLHLALTSYAVGTDTPPGRCLASTTLGWLTLRCAVTPDDIEALDVLIAVP